MEVEEMFSEEYEVCCPECTSFESGVQNATVGPAHYIGGLLITCDHRAFFDSIQSQFTKSNWRRDAIRSEDLTEEQDESGLIQTYIYSLKEMPPRIAVYITNSWRVICLHCGLEMKKAHEYEDETKDEYGFTCPEGHQRIVVVLPREEEPIPI